MVGGRCEIAVLHAAKLAELPEVAIFGHLLGKSLHLQRLNFGCRVNLRFPNVDLLATHKQLSSQLVKGHSRELYRVGRSQIFYLLNFFKPKSIKNLNSPIDRHRNDLLLRAVNEELNNLDVRGRVSLVDNSKGIRVEKDDAPLDAGCCEQAECW